MLEWVSTSTRWGWDDDEQREFFDRRSHVDASHVLAVGDERIGAVSIEERPDELILGNVKHLAMRTPA